MIRICFFALLVAVLSVSCHHRSPVDKNPAPAGVATGVEINVADLATDKDLVCGMPVEKGGIADTASFEGKLYGFCATECKAEFLKNPTAYLSQ